MKKIIPLCLALLSIAVFLGLIFKNEWHLKHSQSIYVRLQPVDPRSILQGDYMRLNYQLYFAPQNSILENTDQQNTNQQNINQEEHIFSGHYFDQIIQNKSSIVTYVELDPQRRVIHTSFEPLKNVQIQRLVLQNPNNRYTMLYPASKSFLFAEGLAECYQQAEYAEFKVDEQGNAILNALKGNQLQDLGCEKQAHWLDSFDRAKT
ncbi:GDYXXLXY domain-containing protein [Acinetobacter sp. P8-3-8]|uniref:GDYXXLXY domain-containing protein n=1 Tax=Acinetobacter sp. P8-3-8 TaxID=1029823 RepID=UPI0002487DE3|nr:GDYXXLXY domain-containing protein [Acinetobacter sp. P8-3-8]